MAAATIGNVWRSAYAIDRSRIALFGPLRGLFTAVVILTAGVLLEVPELAISAAIGALFAGVLDLGEPYPMRMRAMLWATLWCSLAAWSGALVSEHLAWHLLLAAAVALIGGFAGALGLHGGLIGLVSLVVFVIYSGTPVPSTGTGAKDAAVMALGGLLATALALCAWPLRRYAGTRASVAAAYRTLALAWQPGTGVAATSPAVAAAVVRAGDLVERSHLRGDAGRWLQSLVAQAERIRLTLVALSPQLSSTPDRPGPTAKATAHAAPGDANELVTAAQSLTMAISRAIAWEPSRARLGPAVEGMAAAMAGLPTHTDPKRRQLIETLADQLNTAASAVSGSWPRAQHRLTEVPADPLPWHTRAASHLHRDDLFVGHAVRLAVAIVLGVSIAAAVGRPHSYWIPMTVAWLAKPDLAGTVTRIPARVLGTVAGVVIAATVVFPAEGRWWLILWSGIGAGVVLAFLWANYAVAVAGITVFVLAAFALTGSDERADVIERVVYTLMAAVIVFAIALIRPRRSGQQAMVLLAETCAAMNTYAVAIRAGEAGAAQRAAVLKARSAAASALAAAAVEPKWRRDSASLDPARAQEMLGDLVEATAALLTEELLSEQGIDDPAIWGSFDEEIARLEEELRTQGGPPATGSPATTDRGRPLVDHPITTPVHRARIRLRPG